MRNELPWGERTVERLMCVARDKRLREATHGPLLPNSWRTLYELTRLSDEQFAALLADGTINPEMSRADVAEGVTRLAIAKLATALEIEREPASPYAVQIGLERASGTVGLLQAKL